MVGATSREGEDASRIGDGRLLFEIAVYRCSPGTYYSRDLPRLAERYRWLRPEPSFFLGYNQVVGWLQVFALPQLLKGYLWWTTARRVPIRPRMDFQPDPEKVWELQCWNHQSSDEVFRQIRAEITALKRSHPIRGRYIDTEAFDTLGPFVDWRTLLQLND
jgi:hypothetical protein